MTTPSSAVTAYESPTGERSPRPGAACTDGGTGTGMGACVIKGIPPRDTETGACPQGSAANNRTRRSASGPWPQPSRSASALNSAHESAGCPGVHSFWDTARSGMRMPAATWSWVCAWARSPQMARRPPRIWPE